MINAKRIFSSFVSFVTILWSVGAGALAFPVTAQAATLNAGDLIKASGPAVYYYANDGMRYVFPDEKTYFSWFNDFSSVVTITDAELAAITIGGNVTIRPGTKLVKIQTDPKTYAVTKCGTLHWIESEAIAKALWGDAWATRVVDVSDSFFVNYDIGSSISSNVHPNGQLITYTGDTNRYVVWEGQKRMIADDAAFAANRWNMANAVETTISYPDGASVTGLEADNFWMVACGGQTVSGSVTVALASDTPAGATVPKNAMSVPMVKVNVTAGSADALLTGLHFHRVGVGSTSDFANVYLYDGMGNRLTTGRSVNSTSNKVEFNALNQTIPANTTKTFYVYADFSSPATTGGNHAFELADAASVVLSGTGTVSGSFPVRGNVFIVGTANAGTLTIQAGPTPANPVIGSKNAPIASFKLTANTNDIYVHRVALYQGGDIDNSDLANFELYQGTTKVAASASVNAKGQMVLAFDSPYMIPDGVTRVFELRADVSGRAGRTIKTYVEYSVDIYAMDSIFNSGAAITIADYNGDGAPANDFSQVTTQGGNLTFAFNGPPSSNVAKGKLGVTLYKFSLTSSDNDLEVRRMQVNLARVAAGGELVGSAGTKYFRNVKIVNLDNGQTIMGPKELTIANGTTNETFTFNDTFNVMTGQTLNLAVVADLANTEDAVGEFIGKTYRVTWKAFIAGDVKVVDTGENLALTKIVPNADTAGNIMTVKQSSLDAKLASTPVSGTVVKKAMNKPVVGVALEAGAQSAIKVTNLTLDCQASIAGAAYDEAQCAQRITSLSLWDGDTKVGDAQAPDSTTGEAPISNMNLDIPAGTTKNLTVKATFSSAASSPVYDKISVGVKAAGITAQDDDANTVTPTIETKLNAGAGGQTSAAPTVVQTILPNGTLTVTQDAHPSATIVIAGKDVWVPFARYKATAQFENMLIDRVAVTSTVGGDNANFVQVAVASEGAVKGANVLPAGKTGMADVDLTGNNIEVPKDGTANFELWAKLSTIQASSSVSGAWDNVTRSGHAPGLGLLENYQTGNWDANYAGNLNLQTTGESSGERVYAAQGATDGASMVLRKSKPVVTKQSLGSTTLTAGLTPLYKVQVGADSAGSIALKQMVFGINKTTNVTLGNFRLYRGASEVTTGNYTIVDQNGVDLKAGSTTTNSFYVVVAFTSEDSISGTGNIYTLYADVSGTLGAGQYVKTDMYRDPAGVPNTGYLVNSAATGILGADAEIFNINTGATPDATAEKVGSFVWSDNSEVPHNYTSGSSRDWTNDVYVEDLTQSQTVQTGS
ncbi:MAG: hypothetical protein ACOYUZ_06110 [Patescibacteria group bacterium]